MSPSFLPVKNMSDIKYFTWQKFVIKAVCVVSVSQAMAVRVAMAVLFGGMLLFN